MINFTLDSKILRLFLLSNVWVSTKANQQDFHHLMQRKNYQHIQYDPCTCRLTEMYVLLKRLKSSKRLLKVFRPARKSLPPPRSTRNWTYIRRSKRFWTFSERLIRPASTEFLNYFIPFSSFTIFQSIATAAEH